MLENKLKPSLCDGSHSVFYKSMALLIFSFSFYIEFLALKTSYIEFLAVYIQFFIIFCRRLPAFKIDVYEAL